ncbi:hypothetical protein FNF29_05093 [Cafeteria roenbergensis]|uniref:Uncharacterized protein n=1 Tax=Cafeteria roenbergensis TaxID=33653 RepID=A0A5A8CCX3_CAFRO|nr:hypothetical protein FNF29_05093 [Cafeteria roenbergensis]|eukprot:KAA0150758.1 hypothetical protein FNF29_05093 [Cafeteria roenbergensis]
MEESLRGFAAANSGRRTLTTDMVLYNIMNSFSKQLAERTARVVDGLESLRSEASATSTRLRTVANTLSLLGNTQFVENRVGDDEDTAAQPAAGAASGAGAAGPVTETALVVVQDDAEDIVKAGAAAATSSRSARAVALGLGALRLYGPWAHDHVEPEEADAALPGVPDADAYRFAMPLPAVIGTAPFADDEDPTLGLEMEEEEEEEEEEAAAVAPQAAAATGSAETAGAAGAHTGASHADGQAAGPAAPAATEDDHDSALTDDEEADDIAAQAFQGPGFGDDEEDALALMDAVAPAQEPEQSADAQGAEGPSGGALAPAQPPPAPVTQAPAMAGPAGAHAVACPQLPPGE